MPSDKTEQTGMSSNGFSVFAMTNILAAASMCFGAIAERVKNTPIEKQSWIPILAGLGIVGAAWFIGLVASRQERKSGVPS